MKSAIDRGLKSQRYCVVAIEFPSFGLCAFERGTMSARDLLPDQQSQAASATQRLSNAILAFEHALGLGGTRPFVLDTQRRHRARRQGSTLLREKSGSATLECPTSRRFAQKKGGT